MRARIVRDIVQATITGRPRRRRPSARRSRRCSIAAAGFDDDIRTNASGPYAGVADATFAEAGVQSFNRQIESYLAGDGVEINPLLDAVAVRPGHRLHRPARPHGRHPLDAEATDLQDDAAARAAALHRASPSVGLVLALLRAPGSPAARSPGRCAR